MHYLSEESPRAATVNTMATDTPTEGVEPQVCRAVLLRSEWLAWDSTNTSSWWAANRVGERRGEGLLYLEGGILPLSAGSVVDHVEGAQVLCHLHQHLGNWAEIPRGGHRGHLKLTLHPPCTHDDVIMT